MNELEWPDFLDVETGLFRYYGDNRTAGADYLSKKGNKLLAQVFDMLHAGRWSDIPPFLIFTKGDSGRDVVFRGLAAPGNPAISSDYDLVAFWRSINNARFQNFEAYFTILDTKGSPISRKWLETLISNHDASLSLAPEAWRKFVAKGREGIEALRAPKIVTVPTKYDQLATDAEGTNTLLAIRNYFKNSADYFGFEACAADIVSKIDDRFEDCVLTRPWRDGGRDALGHYSLGIRGSTNPKLKIEFALEAKCYDPANAVGVKQMSRLISRIRYRQFGVMVTTSYVDGQAYSEVLEDGHPILIVSARDIASVLRRNRIFASDVPEWIRSSIARFERAPR